MNSHGNCTIVSETVSNVAFVFALKLRSGSGTLARAMVRTDPVEGVIL